MTRKRSYHPSRETPYFLFDPNDPSRAPEWFATSKERDDAFRELLRLYSENGEWCDSVEEIVAGEVTHVCEQCNEREVETSEDGEPIDPLTVQTILPGVDYLCEYRLEDIK